MQEIESLKKKNLSFIEERSSLIEEKSSLIEEKYRCLQRIKEIESSIKEKNYQISLICKKENNGHIWKTEREDGPYGERYTFCEKCYIDYYGDYYHY